MTSDLSLDDVTIAIVTALPHEYVAVRTILGCGAPIPARGRRELLGSGYSLASVGENVVAVVLLGTTGTNAAAVEVGAISGEFRQLTCVIMCGIAGAVPNPTAPRSHVRLGDIVVSGHPGVIQYDRGKDTSRGFQPTPLYFPPGAGLLKAVQGLETECLEGARPWESIIETYTSQMGGEWARPLEATDILSHSDDETVVIPHPVDPDRRPGVPRVFVGPIASANLVQKNAKHRDEIRDKFNVYAFEMEGAGIAEASYHLQLSYIIVRATCDYCDPLKNRIWQHYAAVAAAAYTRCLIEVIPPPRRSTTIDRAPGEVPRQAEIVPAPTDPLPKSIAERVRREGAEQQNRRSAAEQLLSLGRQLGDPDILKKIAFSGDDQESTGIILSAVERLIDLLRSDSTARREIAIVCMHKNDFHGAAEQFRRLAEKGELEDTDRYNWALCLARAGDTGGSRRVLEELANPATIPLPACLLRADILTIEESPAAAFESLRQVRQRFWQEPGFLQAWMTLGFKSSNEPEGHEALVQLQTLQAEGRARGGFLKAVSIDEIAAHIEDRAEKHREARREMVHGRMSWLVVDTAFGEPPYWGWRLRTQELRWLADEPVERARFTTYATNGFRVGTRQDLAWLERIECPPRGTSVVADLSALISLHRLGLLGVAADYFGRVLIPAAYLQNLLEEAGRLLPHQSSRLQAANTIWEALGTGRVSVTDDPSVERLSEYERIGEGSPPMRLRDVLDVLHQAGRLPDSRYRGLLRRAHQPATGGLRAGRALVVEIETLRTLTDADVLGDVVQAFQVGITSDDRAQLQGEIAAFEAQANVRRWHADLWKTVRADSRFVQAIDSPVSERESEEPGPLARIPLVGVLLARDRAVPLLADDRCCQMIAINERPLDETAAFGTDALLDALFADGAIAADTAADAYLHLMAWRYRFIVVPAEVLVALAARYADHPPGQELREVAAYVHDSMRDAGLFGGPERTDPPVSMAQKLFMHWTSTISEFLALLWRDPDWPEDRLKAVTSWAVAELYPSVPRNSELGRWGIDGLWNRHVLSHFLIAVGRGSDASRANAGVRALASALALSEDEYLRILTGVVDEA